MPANKLGSHFGMDKTREKVVWTVAIRNQYYDHDPSNNILLDRNSS